MVWSTDVGPKISQNVDKFLTFFKLVWDHLGCVWGVVRGPQEQLLSQIFSIILCVFEVSGRVQEGPRSPPDPLKIHLCVHKFFMF